MKYLYHYTTIQTLCSIVNGINNNNIFLKASNANKMNDPNDCYYFIDILGNIDNSYNNTISKIIDEKSKFDSPYLVSLTEHQDDLHMWNCYGDDGKGVAIGFSYDLLKKAVESFFEKNHISAHLHKCFYKSQGQLKNDIHIVKLITKEPVDNTYIGNVKIADFANIVKHPCYRYEKEYRIVIKHGIRKPTINNVYKEREDSFYLNVPIDVVRQIVVGPNANYEAVKKIFSTFFNKKQTKFIQSKIPYRSR